MQRQIETNIGNSEKNSKIPVLMEMNFNQLSCCQMVAIVKNFKNAPMTLPFSIQTYNKI